jgi:hypothetical protein
MMRRWAGLDRTNVRACADQIAAMASTRIAPIETNNTRLPSCSRPRARVTSLVQREARSIISIQRYHARTKPQDILRVYVLVFLFPQQICKKVVSRMHLEKYIIGRVRIDKLEEEPYMLIC